MEQNIQIGQINYDEIKCEKGNKAILICATKNCKERPYICSLQQCQCSRKIHYNCVHTRYQNIIERVSSKRGALTKQYHQFCNEIIKIYNQVIDKLSTQRQLFYLWKDYVGLSQNQKQLLISGEKNQDSRINGDIVNTIIENIKQQEKYIIKSTQQLKNQWNNQKKQLDSLITILNNLYLKKYQNILNSTVAKDISIIQRYFQSETIVQFKLLYRGSIDNFSISKFHQKCDGISNTLTIAKTLEGTIVGGYTAVAWGQSSQGFWKNDTKPTFLIKNEKIQTSTKGIYLRNDLGPVFGGGIDIVITQKQSSLGYKMPQSYGSRSYNLYTNKNITLNREERYKQLQIVDWEVYRVYFQKK